MTAICRTGSNTPSRGFTSGYYADIRRTDDVGNIRNARNLLYRGGPFKAREEAVSEVLAVAKNNFYREDGNNGRKGKQGTAHTAPKGQEKGNNDSTGTQTVRGTTEQIVRGKPLLHGRLGGLNSAFGQSPTRSWANVHVVEPKVSSAAYAEQQTAMEYGMPGFVVRNKF